MNDSYKITSRSRERFSVLGSMGFPLSESGCWKRLLLYIEKVLYRSDPEAGRRAVSIFASPIYGSSEIEWFVPSEIFGFKPQIRKLSEYDQNVQQEITQRLIGIIEDLRNRAMKAAEDPESAEQKVLISYLYDPYRFYKYGCALEFNPEEDIYVINDHDPIIAGWGLKDKSADSAAGQIFYKVHSCEPEQKMDADRAESETVQPEKKTFYEEKTATAAFSSFSEDNEQSIPENSTTNETVSSSSADPMEYGFKPSGRSDDAFYAKENENRHRSNVSDKKSDNSGGSGGIGCFILMIAVIFILVFLLLLSLSKSFSDPESETVKPAPAAVNTAKPEPAVKPQPAAPAVHKPRPSVTVSSSGHSAGPSSVSGRDKSINGEPDVPSVEISHTPAPAVTTQMPGDGTTDAVSAGVSETKPAVKTQEQPAHGSEKPAAGKDGADSSYLSATRDGNNVVIKSADGTGVTREFTVTDRPAQKDNSSAKPAEKPSASTETRKPAVICATGTDYGEVIYTSDCPQVPDEDHPAVVVSNEPVRAAPATSSSTTYLSEKEPVKAANRTPQDKSGVRVIDTDGPKDNYIIDDTTGARTDYNDVVADVKKNENSGASSEPQISSDEPTSCYFADFDIDLNMPGGKNGRDLYTYLVSHQSMRHVTFSVKKNGNLLPCGSTKVMKGKDLRVEFKPQCEGRVPEDLPAVSCDFSMPNCSGIISSEGVSVNMHISQLSICPKEQQR